MMASAEDFKEKGSGPSIHELSFINLSIGRVSILALSSLDSWLAASVANQIHFFSMSALLHKVQASQLSLSYAYTPGLSNGASSRQLAF